MKKISIFFVYLISFIYLEFLYRILLYDNIFRISNINMIIFVIFFALVLYLLTKLLKEKGNKFFFFSYLLLICLWFTAQYVVKGFLDFYISFSILQIADQVGSFLGKALLEISKRIVGITFIFIPFILSIIFRKKIDFQKNSFKKDIILVVLCVLSFSLYYVSLNINKNEDYSAYELFHNTNNPSLNIEKVGIINTFWVDIYRTIFGFDEKIIIAQKNNNNDLKEEIEKVYEYNNLNIDFESLLNDTNDSVVKDMTEYFMNETGTLQNDYTNMFEGKNLILFMAESFNEIALSENTMPTLYGMYNNGFKFTNFYTPTIFSTIGGEFQELSGLYANFSSLSKWRSGSNTFPMGIGTMFQNIGYNTYAYHNHYYTFQDRNVYLNKLGFTNFKGCYNGLETLINCNQWPESDVEMIEATYKDYIDSEEPFMVFYASVSGHASYNWGNAMAKKHKEEIESLNLGYSTPVLAYLAAQMELDDAIESLIQKLKDAGKLDDTVIVLAGDHYPYELTTSQVNEAATYEKDGVIEINHSKLIIWNNKMDTIEINKVGSQIDIIPTIYNLFGLKYDSRLFIGNDILSTEPGLAMFGDNSWVSNQGKYFASSGTFIPNSEVEDDYYRLMNQDVQSRIAISKYIIDKDYYKIAWNYLINE